MTGRLFPAVNGQMRLITISPDFMASDYCHEVEMKRAMERHFAGEAVVIPVILRPVDWRGAMFDELQALPKDAKAITLWNDRDEAFMDVAEGIRKVAEELEDSNKGSSGPYGRQDKTDAADAILYRRAPKTLLLEGAAPARIPVGHSRYAAAKISVEGSSGLRRKLDSDQMYGISSENVQSQQFSIVFPNSNGTALPLAALIRLKSPDFEPQQQEHHIQIAPDNDSPIIPFQVKAGQSGIKFLTLELLVENRFIVARGLRTAADDQDPPGGQAAALAVKDTNTLLNWSVVARLALSIVSFAEATFSRYA
jgi:hypothetical protein